MQSPLQILFIDDHRGLLEGISSVLHDKDERLQFFLAPNTETAERLLRETPGIALAVVDVNLDGENGLEAVQRLRAVRSDLNVLIYSMYTDLFHIKAALDANVQGYVSKKSSSGELLQAIYGVAAGEASFCSEVAAGMAKLVADKAPAEPSETQMLFLNYKSLSRSEKEVFKYLAEKTETAEIARLMGKSEKTVLNKRTIICQKLGLSDRLDIVDAAKTLGVIG